MPLLPRQHYIQRNTIMALKFLEGVDVVAFTKEEPVKALAADLGVEVVDDFRTNQFGTPILSSMFQHVDHHMSTRFVGYDCPSHVY